MLKWLKSIVLGPQPTGPPQILRAFDPAEPTLAGDVVRVEDESFVVEAQKETTVSLFELKTAALEPCILTYKANAKAEGLEGKAYLEMQLKFPKLGEHSAKGVNTSITGSTDWTPLEAPVLLDGGQVPDKLKLNVVVEGQGTVRMKDVEVLRTPIS